MMSKILSHHEDLMCTIELSPANEVVVDVIIKEWVGTFGDDKPLYRRDGGKSSADTTESYDQAETTVSGNVKWDGCSNWEFFTERCALHSCSEYDLRQYFDRIILARKLAGKFLGDKWNGDE